MHVHGKPSLGIWIWNANEHFHWSYEELHKLGYRWIAVKAHDGGHPYNDPRLIDEIRLNAHRAGLLFGLWGYTRSGSDAHTAAALVSRYEAQFYIADAETEYEKARGPESRIFAQTFRTVHPKMYCAVSSFGRIDLHPAIDWRGWHAHAFEFMPQAYECDSSELTPGDCLRAAERVWARDQVQPTLGAYAGARGRLSSQHLADSVRGLGLRGVNWWEGSSVTPQDLTDLARVL